MLFCVANLTDKTLQSMNFLQEKSNTLESATLACERLSTEMREMVDTPDLSPPITFLKVIPSSPPFVGNVATEDPDDWLRSYPAAQRASISYSISGQKVVRQVNSEPPLDVASNVNAFDVTELNRPGDYLLRLSIIERRRVVIFETIVVCPGVPRT